MHLCSKAFLELHGSCLEVLKTKVSKSGQHQEKMSGAPRGSLSYENF